MTDAALVKQNSNPYQIMDRLDDELIKAELENRIVDTWVYSFKGNDGRLQSGLSKVGVDAACTEMAKSGHIIREGEVTYQRDPTDPDYILFQGMARRFVLDHENNEVEMEAVNGTKRQWIKMKKRDGNVVADPFWFEKGAMKALRNARARMIPEEIRTKIITLAKQKGRIKPIDDDKSPAPKPNNAKPTAKQVKMIFGKGQEHDLSQEETTQIVEWWRKGDKLTKAEASALIDRMVEDWDGLLDDFLANQKTAEGEPKDIPI